MKKILLLSLLFVFSVSLIAQMRPTPPKANRIMTKEERSAVVSFHKSFKDIVSYGDTIVTDDFSTGGPGSANLPTGWTTDDVCVDANGFVWQWTDEGATGPTTEGYEHVLASTTASNGWMIIDSDNYLSGNYDAILVSPAYDLSAESSVALVFEELYKRWGNETSSMYTGNPTFVGVSVDSGLTWTDIELHADFEVKETTDNPAYVMINLTGIAANQSDVMIRFQMQGNWDYWWQIDDFRLIVAADYNSELVATFVSQVGNYSNGVGLTGYHSLIPLSQSMDTWFEGDVWNNGNLELNNVSFNVTVTDGGGSSVFEASNDTVVLPFDSTKALIIQPPYFTPTTADTYTSHFSCSQTEIDEVPENNTMPDISFTYTNNEVFAHDVSFTRATSPEFYTDGTDGDMVGCTYHIENDATVISISVFIDYRSDPGTMFVGQIYSFDGTVWSVQIQSEEYYITSEDLGTWIEVPMVAYSPGTDDLLSSQNDYIAGVEFYYGTENLWIGADDAGPHLYNIETNLRIGAEYFWIHELPLIRLNLEGAVLPPKFITYPDTFTCKSPFVYEYTAEVTDESGADCSFELIQSPDWINLVDNNDNTATLTGIAPANALGLSYLIEIEVDNGTSTNQQWYVLDVMNQDSCTSHINIDPVFLNPVSIFPNPAKDAIYISNAQNSDIYIYNIVGELVASRFNSEAFLTIDVSEYAQGSYLVKVISNVAVTTQKINLIK